MKQSFILICMTLFITSCNHRKPKNLIVFGDFSKSVDTSTINWYQRSICSHVIQNMDQIDRITVLPADGGTYTATEEIFQYDFSKNIYGNEYAGFGNDEIKTKSHKDSIASAETNFSRAFYAVQKKRIQYAQATDIFGAFAIAKKYMVADDENIIVFFSDMQESEGNNTIVKTDNYKIDKEFTIDLSNAEIIVLTGEEKNITPDKFEKIKSFWDQFITKCNGKLVDFSSGSFSPLDHLLNHN